MPAFGRPVIPPHDRGYDGLARVIGIDEQKFAREFWGRRPLVSRAAELPSPFTDLICSSAVDELVSYRGLRTPFLRMAKDGVTLADRAFTAGGGVGAGVGDQVSDDKLLALFAAGATMVLQGLHRTWPAIIDFAQALSGDLGHPVQVNAYVTPAQNTGFADHYDVHDVFVLQVEGSKQWRVREPVLTSPLRDQPSAQWQGAVDEAAGTPAMFELTLDPGDCLYLPRGYLHSATALGAVSTHLTVGVHPWTRYTLVEELTRAVTSVLAQDERMRASLPLGVDLTSAGSLTDEIETVRTALLDALAQLGPSHLQEPLSAAVRASQRAAPIAPLATVAAADALAPGHTLRLRRHLAASLDGAAGTAVLKSRSQPVEVSSHDVAAVQHLLSAGACTLGDLGKDLARQLVLAGVVDVGAAQVAEVGAVVEVDAVEPAATR